MSANTRCSLLARIMLCPVIQLSHQNAPTLEAVKTLNSSFVAISTFYSGGMTLFDRQHMKQTVDEKVGRQVLQVSTARDSTFSSTLWACNDIMTYHGGRSFVECRLSSEDKSCVNMATVLDQ